jgi:anti-anti-sigma regulatory factor
MKNINYNPYKGRNEKYNMINLNCEYLNLNNSQIIKSEFVSYFLDKKYKEVGAKRHCLNMENIEDIDSSGLSSLLVFNKLNKDIGYPPITLVGCSQKIKRIFNLTQYNFIFKFVDNIKDL